MRDPDYVESAQSSMQNMFALVDTIYAYTFFVDPLRTRKQVL